MKRLLGLTAVVLLVATASWAHCDTMNGPVIADARLALANRDVTPVLKWIAPRRERQIKRLFDQTLTSRARGGAAQDRADMRFFTELVRIHRAGEGVAFTGIKPASTPVDPVIAAADASIDSGVVDPLLNGMIRHLTEGLRSRYERVLATKAHVNDSVEAGREYVEAYVAYMHYVEGVAAAIHAESGAHHAEAAGSQAANGRHSSHAGEEH